MATIIGVGDNVVDKYKNLRLMFPGGNALNVAVMAHRYGLKTAYLGWLGNDRAGRHIYNTLKKENIDISRVRIIEGMNAYDEVILEDGERKFVGSAKGIAEGFCLSEDDFSFISNFNLIHTSVYSLTEKYLPHLKKTGGWLSFDYSDISKLASSYLDDTLPYVDLAFFSAGNETEKSIKDFQVSVSEKGPGLTVVTRGSQGAILYNKGNFYFQPIVPVKIVDTLGAGDAFIARCLKGILESEEMANILREAAKEAAQSCLNYGAFGYPSSIR